MTGTSVTVTVDDVAVMAAIAGAARAADDMRPAFERIGAYLVASVQRRFEHGAGPGGVAWPQSYRAKRDSGKTLVDTARLMQSITHAATRDAATVGTNVVYAAIHQFGGQIGIPARTVRVYRRLNDVLSGGPARFVRRRQATLETEHQARAYTVDMPARPFLGIDAADSAEIREIIADYLVERGQP